MPLTFDIYILAPLSVVPEHQKQGVGNALIQMGITVLKAMDVKPVFVLGHPTYYLTLSDGAEYCPEKRICLVN